MKYFTVPPPVTAVLADGTPGPYGFDGLLRQFVWPDPAWRADVAAARAFHEARQLLQDAQPGAIVALSDDLYERLSPLVLLRGQRLEVPELMGLMLPWLEAASKAPESSNG